MTYKEQLNTINWKNKRQIILERDNFQCRKCCFKRPETMSILDSFGIKSIQEFKELGNLIDKSNFRINEKTFIFLNSKNKLKLEVAYVIGEYDNDLDFNNLKFAKQLESRESIESIKYKIICFKENFDFTFFSDLNIHHKLYILDKMAWEYDDEDLITLCSNCHQLEHDNNEIYIYKSNGEKLRKVQNCHKCGGSGYIPSFNYYENGICFECDGEGVIL